MTFQPRVHLIKRHVATISCYMSYRRSRRSFVTTICRLCMFLTLCSHRCVAYGARHNEVLQGNCIRWSARGFADHPAGTQCMKILFRGSLVVQQPLTLLLQLSILCSSCKHFEQDVNYIDDHNSWAAPCLISFDLPD
jgi:hypothetical protein